jgi:glucokinase
MTSFLLAGDIGGTKTALAIIDRRLGARFFVEKAVFPSSSYASLAEMVAEFLKGKEYRLARASVGVAGPVIDGRALVTNLPWVIDSQEMGRQLGIPFRLLNDLEAIAHAVPSLAAGDVETLNPGLSEGRGALAVIAPGTGLGEAFLMWDGKRYHPFPSEGGHAGFGPEDALQIDLLAYLQKRFGHVSWERVCSGIGLPNLYDFLRDSGRCPEPDWLKAQLAVAADPAPIIGLAAEQGKAEIAVATMDLFAAILASEAGNLALKVLATGGVYLGGGIPPRILPVLKKDFFLKTFQDKGRFSRMLAGIPVHVILNPEAALIGAASHGLEQERLLD